MRLDINKDTTLCMSLSARPSNFGTRFHNYLYQELGLNYLYKAFQVDDIENAIKGVRGLKVRGCAISMPFKEVCIQYLDELDQSAKTIDSVNTIVNTDGYLKAYNTDYIAVAELLKNNQVPKDIPFVLKGSGGMAKAVLGALYDLGYKFGTIVARNRERGEYLAKIYNYEYAKSEDELPSEKKKMLINVTPIGMAGGKESELLSFSENDIVQADIIFDVVALPVETPLIKMAQSKGKKIISGFDVGVIQALEQFVLYTGVRPTIEQVKAASTYAKS